MAGFLDSLQNFLFNSATQDGLPQNGYVPTENFGALSKIGYALQSLDPNFQQQYAQGLAQRQQLGNEQKQLGFAENADIRAGLSAQREGEAFGLQQQARQNELKKQQALANVTEALKAKGITDPFQQLSAFAQVDPETYLPKIAQFQQQRQLAEAQNAIDRQRITASQASWADKPKSVQEYEYFKGLSPDEQNRFLGLNGGGGNKEDKPIPSSALKLQNEELDRIGTAQSINADLGNLVTKLDSGKLDLGVLDNLTSRGLNSAGLSTENSRNFATFNATLEKLRNDSLRLNAGVQTEGDAQRAWNEILSNTTDPELVSQRLKEVQQINQRAADLRKLNVDQIRANYGKDPIDYSAYDVKSALTPSTDSASSGGWSIRRK